MSDEREDTGSAEDVYDLEPDEEITEDRERLVRTKSFGSGTCAPWPISRTTGVGPSAIGSRPGAER